MKRITFARLAVLMLAVAGLALSGCGGDDNGGGISAADMARIDAAEMAAETAEGRADAAEMAAETAEGRADAAEMAAETAEGRADAAEMANEDLEDRLDELESRIDQEGFPSTDPQSPTSGPQVDIGVEHVTGITEAAGDVFITNSPLKPRITPSHFLSESYDTERRHHDVALVNGTAAVGFGGRQYLDDDETYGGWMEYNHFGVFVGTDDDGRGFTDLWSIGARSDSNPGGTELEWTGAFVGQEMMHADNMGNRMRGSAKIEVMLGDPLMAGMLQVDRARLTIGGDDMSSDIVNIDNSSATPPYGDYGLITGVLADPWGIHHPYRGWDVHAG